jgi:uncharacterized cofD-like protein
MSEPRRRWAATIGLRRWLTPGIGIKRWLVVVFLGELGLAFGLAFVLRQVYRDVDLVEPVQSIVSAVTLQFLPYWLRAVILASLGVAIFAFAAWKVVRVLTGPYRSDDEDRPLVEVIYQKRFLARGPRIVALGGGTGLSTLLRGLKEHTSNLTAVVTVADDGGSSGKLREQLGVPPVGDIRNCIVALADAEPLMGRLLQYRFPGEDAPESLGGHAVGNLLIAAMTAVQDGDFEEGVRQMNRVLAVRGQVVPASSTPLILHAELSDGTEVVGQSRIAATSGIERVWLMPERVSASADAVAAIAEADVLVIGPGSLFTSVLPALLLPEIRAAVLASTAPRIYVCNVATQPGETSDFDLADHVEALERHVSSGIVDIVLANNRTESARSDVRPSLEGHLSDAIRLRWPPNVERPPRLVLEDLVDPDDPRHHDPVRLAAAIIRIAERDGAARRRGGGVARTA